MSHSVSLNWTASIDQVDGYNIYRGTSAGGEAATPINGSTLVTATSFVDASVLEGSTYDYYVTAVKSGIESLHSNEVSAVILPGAPSNLVATAA